MLSAAAPEENLMLKAEVKAATMSTMNLKNDYNGRLCVC